MEGPRVSTPPLVLFEFPTVASFAKRIEIAQWAEKSQRENLNSPLDGREEIEL